ncbi:probable polyol transporter 3 [Papilio machaon]|uniref:probable polyol transporter 3 n=1 Tax=Papilio machaon TaxID=76193 RepID=UPI001E6638B1|nr:probable polyol transporter 3 [Papilio machaon]
MIRLETLRQFFIVSGLTICSISDGFIFGQMSGMVNALIGKEDGIALSDNDVSLIASLINVTCIFGFGMVAVLGEKIGRRHTIAILTVPVLISYIMVYFGKEKTTFFISRIIVGVSYGGVLLLITVAMAEYTNPNNRAICVNYISSIGPSIGTMLGHVLSTLLHWRTVALIGLIPTGLSAILPLFWIESPSWLATRGRFEECKEAFISIRGTSQEAEAELQLLIDTERKSQSEVRASGKNFSKTMALLRKALKQKYFWKIYSLAIIINIYRIAAGKLLFSTLAITMLQEITGTSNILLSTVIVDGFIILGNILSFFALSKMKMRPLMFSLGLVANTMLLILSACLYFIPKTNAYYSWINVCLLAFYFILAYTGPYAVIDIIISEIFPLDLKLFFMLFASFLIASLSFLSIYIAPIMFATIGYSGVFFLNATISFICLLYLWFYLPETKGRTLQEIELFFKKGKFCDLQSNEQATGLL